jgi:hypothetical protein
MESFVTKGSKHHPSYEEMISKALLSSKRNRATLLSIEKYIVANYEVNKKSLSNLKLSIEYLLVKELVLFKNDKYTLSSTLYDKYDSSY